MTTNVSESEPNKRELIYPELSYQLTGIFFKVHNKLGNMQKEVYYQRAVEEELKAQGIPYRRELSVDFKYDDKKIGKHVVDFVIDGKILLELKTADYLKPHHLNQTLSYLKDLNLKLGIIANFRKERLQYKRVIHPGIRVN